MDDGIREPNQDLVELVENHYEMLFRYSYRLTGSAADAEDVVQQTFLTAQAKIDQLREANAARSWLFTIARNTYLKSIRDKVGQSVSLESVLEPTQPVEPETEIDSEELQAVLNELPEEYKAPLILFYFQEFSYKEIAAQLEVPIGTVMSRLARAKSILRRRIAPQEPTRSSSRPESDSDG